jgi:flavin reductase (DIM6/NTAB) family NADH-FMN oxidoreductase RutF
VADADFDDLVGSLDPGMLVVTTAADGLRAGCLVGFHSQCSIEPRRYAVWISKANETYRVARRAETFGVHLVPADGFEIAALFGGETGDEIDKFEQCRWTEGPDGVPLLEACPDRFVGQRVDLVEVTGDHVCLVLAPGRTDRGGADARSWLTLEQAEAIPPGHPA